MHGAKFKERRKSSRIAIHRGIMVLVGDEITKKVAKLHDFSREGFSFYYDPPLTLPDGPLEFFIVAVNEENGRDLCLNNVNGSIVSSVKISEWPKLNDIITMRYGLKFINLNDWQQYLLENFFGRC